MIKRIEPEQPDAFDESALIETHAASVVDGCAHESVHLAGVSAQIVHARSAVFNESRIEGASLVGSSLPDARFVDCVFNHADMTAATWMGLRMVRVHLDACKLTGFDAHGGELRDVRFTHCKVPDAMLQETELTRVLFDSCRLTGMDLSGARIRSAAAFGCDARNLRLSGARIDMLDLRGSMIDGISIEPGSINGLVIDPTQAPAILASLGADVLDAE